MRTWPISANEKGPDMGANSTISTTNQGGSATVATTSPRGGETVAGTTIPVTNNTFQLTQPLTGAPTNQAQSSVGSESVTPTNLNDTVSASSALQSAANQPSFLVSVEPSLSSTSSQPQAASNAMGKSNGSSSYIIIAVVAVAALFLLKGKL
jgi:hypothetical protein